MTPDSEKAHFAELDALWAKNWPAGVPRALNYPHGRVPLFSYITQWARLDPERAAVNYYGSVWTYAQYDAMSDKVAALLAAHGVRKGDRVAIMMQNCPQYQFVFYGILKLGAVYTAVSPMSKSFELSHQLRDSGARVIVAQDQVMDLVREAREAGLVDTVFVTSLAETLPENPAVPIHPSIPRTRIECADAIDLLPALDATGRDYPDNAVGLDDLAALNYTGGTTGLPKGCMHTHGNMLYTASSSRSLFERGDKVETTLVFFPQFWIAGENASLIGPLLNGETVVLLARWDPAAILDAIQKFKVAQLTLPVDSAIEIIELPELDTYDLSSLTAVRVLGLITKLTIELRREWEKKIGVTLIESSWGMTETHAFDSFTMGMQNDDFDLKQTRTFVGLPVSGTRFKIADFETGETLPIGQQGELCCLSPSATKGYWQKPEASADLIRDGWIHTGDLGFIGESGHIHYLGRRKEMIKVRGMSVFPAEIETILAMHPAVDSSAVAPRPDTHKGQVPVAFVKLAAEADAAELERWCAERLAVFKVPEVRIVDDFPMTGTGKIKKQVLAERLAAESKDAAA
ncbi:MAG: AMP-binding protein [Mesorhizobium sp.]